MIDTELLGGLRRIEDIDPRLEPALEAMEDAEVAGDPDRTLALARKAVQIEPGCTAALLVLAEYAATRIERVALLKEIISIHKREVRAGSATEITSRWEGASHVLAALACLGDELSHHGDFEGALAIYRQVVALDEDDSLGVRTSLDELERTESQRPGELR